MARDLLSTARRNRRHADDGGLYLQVREVRGKTATAPGTPRRRTQSV
jgi:hypothetical protein